MEWKFTLGVGGAVVRDGQLLLVHHAYGAKMWQIPGDMSNRTNALMRGW